MSWSSLETLKAFYAIMTIAKLGQWVGSYFSRRRRQLEKKIEHASTKGRVEYAPSLDVIFFVLEILLGEGHPSTMPRDELRAVTDPWLQDYKRLLQDPAKRPPKKFSSLRAALCDFYKEFTQDSSGFLVHFAKSTLNVYIAHPLGIISTLDLLIFIVASPVLLFWEIMVKEGNSHTFICKIAASTTANEVYVVSTKDGISFDVAMHKYPWLNGVFSHQLHPMVARSACPLYRREFLLPQKDVMDFDIEIIPNPSGTLVLRQKRSTFLGKLWEDLLPSHLIFLAIVAYYLCTYEITGLLQAVLPYGVVFYVIRFVADRRMGIEWLPRFRWLL